MYVERNWFGAQTGTYDLWATACGLDYCDEEGFYQGNYVGTYFDPTPVTGGMFDLWAYASECCQYPPGTAGMGVTEGYVYEDLIPPLGISKHLKILIRSTSGKCVDYDCVEGQAVWNGVNAWEGSAGAVSIQLWLDTTTFEMRANLGGCVFVGVGVPPIGTGTAGGIVTTCAIPFKGFILIGAEEPCCTCPAVDSIIEINVLGYCRRNYVGRLVDIVHEANTGTYELWAVSDCCEPCEQQEYECCDTVEGCPLYVTFESLLQTGTGTLVCDCPYGDDVLVLMPNVGGHDWGVENFGNADCPAMTFSMYLDCETIAVGNTTCCRFTVRFEAIGTNCSCTTIVEVLGNLCEFVPFELEFGLNLTCVDVGVGMNACCQNYSWGVTVTK